MDRNLRPFIFSFTLLAALSACDSNKSTAPSEAAGESAAKEIGITLPNIDGEDYSIASKSEKDVHVLCFWAVWCTPCQAELAQIKPIWNDLKDKGLNVYAISIDQPDTASRVVSMAEQAGYEFPVLMDRDSSVLGRYNQSGEIPFYVVLDANGEKLKEHQGYTKGDEKELRTYLEGLLNKP
jgi:peroxiredoxin